ncbi:MAG: biopolymer transporter ExbD [Calditrichaceae bacterium]|jgi:biopolymer transport protein ExbD
MNGIKFNMNRANGKSNKAVTDINLTSMVDVCLTLVIIFMVSYPLVMQSGINVSTPSMKKAKTVTEETEIKAEINLKEDYTIELNGSTIAPDLLSDSLKSLMKASKKKLVIVSAEANVLHDHVVAILDEAKQCGAEQLSIIKKKKK